MTRLDRRWLPVLLAALLPACGEESPFTPVPDEDAGDMTKEDTGPGPTFPDQGVRDNGFPTDEGTVETDVPSFDAGVRDTGVRDTGVRDTGPIDTGVRDTGPIDTGPPADPCASSIDLNAMGTLAGETTRYTGSNSAVGTSTTLRPPTTCVIGTATNISSQVAFRYTPRAAARLRVSTDNAGTEAGLDTVVWAQSACAPLAGGAALGCDDDGGEGTRDFTSVFTTTAAVTAGTPVFIVVAGYGTGHPRGAFELTVTEVQPAMSGGACDPRDAAACVSGLRCVPTGTSTTMGTCLADGTAGGRCRTAGMSCDTGLTCSTTDVTSAAGRCRATVAAGATCDPAGAANICAEGSACITASGASTCVANGAVGGRCRMTAPACDAMLLCNGSMTSTTSRCVRTIAVGGACDATGAGDPCVGGSTCLTISGNTTCVADGTAGGRCRTTAPACDGALGCNGSMTSTASRCVAAVAVGGACTASSICASGSTCLASGSGMTCVADGSLGGRCRATGTACDTGLGCNGSVTSAASRCATAVAVGGACTSASLCAAGSSCVGNANGTTCVTDGAAGARCRSTGTACDGALVCGTGLGLDGGRCLASVAIGEACDPGFATNVCAVGSSCALSGDRWLCTAFGTRGGFCRASGSECNASLTCSNIDYCGTPAASGAACDPGANTTVCASGTACAAAAGEATGRCVAWGTAAGAECRSARACNAGLSCSTNGEFGWCRANAAVGAACDRTGRYDTCASGSACAPTTGNSAVCQASVAETEPNNTLATAAPAITASTVFRGALEAGGRDCVAVTVPAGAALFSEVQIPDAPTCASAAADSVVEFYNAAGALISVTDDSPRRGYCSLVDPTFHPELRNLTAGRYTVCLRGYDATDTIASYLFTVGVVR